MTSCESHLTLDRGDNTVVTNGVAESLFIFCRPEAARTRAQSVLWPRQDLGETQLLLCRAVEDQAAWERLSGELKHRSDAACSWCCVVLHLSRPYVDPGTVIWG
jgi:hypothetical protein